MKGDAAEVLFKCRLRRFKALHEETDDLKRFLQVGVKRWIRTVTQTEAARLLKYSVPYVHDVYHGHRPMNAEFFERVLKVIE